MNSKIYYVNSEPMNSALFTSQLQLPDNNNFNRIAVLQASIPISYYLVVENHNTLTLTENGVSTTITVPIGNYNANSFSLVLPALLTASSPNALTYTITYPRNFTDNNTGKLTFSANTTSVAIQISFPASSFLYIQCGFASGSTNSFVAGVSSSTLTSQNVCDFVPESTVFLHSDLVVSENATSKFSDVLQEFYFDNNSVFGIQRYINPDPIVISKKLTNNKVNNSTFSLTDEDGNVLNFNGQKVLFTLMVWFEPEQVLDKEPLPEQVFVPLKPDLYNQA